MSARERPVLPGANGTPMARHRTQRAAVTPWGAVPAPRVLQPLFPTGHGDRELERAGTPGTPGTPVPGAVSPVRDHVSAVQQ